jgi:hypothetical protein
MNLTFSLNNNQTFTVAEEKREDFVLFLNQIVRAVTTDSPTIDTDLILPISELGIFNIPAENQTTLLQWLNDNAIVSLYGTEIIRPLYETSLNFNTNTFN